MKIILSDKAQLDLSRIYSYIVQQSQDSAENLIRSFDSKFKNLVVFPFLGRERESLAQGLRALVVDQYVIFYFAQAHTITIVRIIHSHMDVDVEFQR